MNVIEPLKICIMIGLTLVAKESNSLQKIHLSYLTNQEYIDRDYEERLDLLFVDCTSASH